MMKRNLKILGVLLGVIVGIMVCCVGYLFIYHAGQLKEEKGLLKQPTY